MKIFLLRCFFSFFISYPVFSQANHITDVSLVSDITSDISDKKYLQKYLTRFIGLAADKNNLYAAQNFLLASYVLSDAKCNYLSKEKKITLGCTVVFKRKIKNIIFKGLHASLLEIEIIKKLPLQIGQDISLKEEDKKDFFNKLKSSVDIFLRNKGFYYSFININYVENSENRDIDILVEINKSVLAKVNKVFITGNSPISPNEIKLKYLTMCLSPTRLIDSVTKGSASCYSSELEKETTKNLIEELAILGYVQANVRVTSQFLNPQDSFTPTSCINALDKNKYSSCVDLRIDIDKGPLVVWNIRVQNGKVETGNKFLKFFRSLFAAGALSRVTTSEYDFKSSLDHLISEKDLLNEISFASSRNIDEYEVRKSADKMKEFIISKGYSNASVIPSYTKEGEEKIYVTFDVYLNELFFLNEIQIKPAFLEKYIDLKSMSYLIETRSLFSKGQISYEFLSEAEIVIKNQLLMKGFEHVDTKVDLEAQISGKSKLTFYVSTDERKEIKEIKIVGGKKEIDENLFPLLINCDAYEKKENGLCEGSSFIKSFIDKDKDKILDYYRTNGFLYVDSETEIIEEGSKKVIIYSLFDKRKNNDDNQNLYPQTIKEMLILGNHSVSEEVIKRVFPHSAENNLTPLDVKIGISNLRSSSLFKIDNKLLSGANNSDDIYFLLNLSKMPSLTIDTAFSFSTDRFFSIETKLNENNFLSSMTQLNTSLGLGFFWGRHSYVSNKFVWPMIWGKQLSLTLNVPSFVYDDFSQRPTPTTRLQSKSSLNIDYKLSDLSNLFLKYGLSHTQERMTNSTSNNFSEMFYSLDGLIPTTKIKGKIRGVLTPGINIAHLDNAFLPKKGVSFGAWADISGGPFYGMPGFISLSSDTSFYTTLNIFTFAFHTHFTRIFIEPNKENWNEIKNSTLADRLGGDRSVRGYSNGEIGIETLGRNTKKFPGYFLSNLNFEFRFPLMLNEDLSNLSSALIVDYGSLFPVYDLFSLFKSASYEKLVTEKGIGFSLGTSLRYLLPVGPISLDYAYSPIHRQWNVHLLFGYLF